MMIFRTRDVLPGIAVQGRSVRLRGPNAFPVHRHEFPEVFWISEGEGTHRINGSQLALEPGTIVFVRADDEHGFACDNRGIVVNNIAVHPSWLRGFLRRHYAGQCIFWDVAAPLPHAAHLGTSQLSRLATEFSDLGRSDGGPRAAERLLLNLLHLCTETAREEDFRPSSVPVWLERALRAWSEPVSWVRGTRELARLAGRSEEHVARVVRQTTGRTPTDLLNEHRMRHAAHLLASTDAKVLDVALDCGFSGLGHFYATFNRHHGCSPVTFRKRQPARPV